MGIKLKSFFQMRYETPYEFKRELELILWCHIDDDLWLKIKPQKELPWYESDLHRALCQIFEELALDES